MTAHERGNGRDPILSPVPERPRWAEAPRPRQGASWEELARCYATLAASHDKHLPALYNESSEVRAAINLMPQYLQPIITAAVREAIDGVRVQGLPPVRRPLPSLSEYGVEDTDGGGTRIPPEAWDAIQKRVADLDAAVADAEHAKELADARAAGSKEALEAIEKASDKRRGKVAFWVGTGIAIAGAVGGVIGWLATHVLHL